MPCSMTLTSGPNEMSSAPSTGLASDPSIKCPWIRSRATTWVRTLTRLVLMRSFPFAEAGAILKLPLDYRLQVTRFHSPFQHCEGRPAMRRRDLPRGKSCCCPALSSELGLMLLTGRLLTGRVVRGSVGSPRVDGGDRLELDDCDLELVCTLYLVPWISEVSA